MHKLLNVFIFGFDLFLAVLGFCHLVQAFSSCGQRGCSRVAEQRLSGARVRLPRGMGPFRDQGSNLCPCVGKLVLSSGQQGSPS